MPYTYALTSNTTILRSDGASIPPDPANSDYVQYLAWVAEENTPTPYTPPAPAIPQTVSAFQAKAALLSAGLIPAVTAYMAGATVTPFDQLAWQEAPVFNRDSVTLNNMAAALNLTPDQLDQLFTAAAAIVA